MSEAGGEGRFGTRDALLGARDLRGVTGEEVLHSLGRSILAIGGRTPKASQVSMMMFLG